MSKVLDLHYHLSRGIPLLWDESIMPRECNRYLSLPVVVTQDNNEEHYLAIQDNYASVTVWQIRDQSQSLLDA